MIQDPWKKMAQIDHQFARLWPAASPGIAEGTSGTQILWVCAATAVVAAIAAAVIVAWRWQDLRRDGPAIRALGRAAGLSSAQCRFLQRVAEAGGFRSAGPLLLSRDCFDRAVARCGDSQSFARALAAIRRRVFGEGCAGTGGY